MTAEIVNLRQARKSRARAVKQAQAEENRAKYGTSKAERQRRSAEAERAARQLDGAQLSSRPDHSEARDGAGPDRDGEPPVSGA